MIQADIVVDVSTMEDENGICTKCSHDFGQHILMATLISPQHGGLIFCNIPDCLCQSTWSIEGQPEPYIPDDETVAELRRTAQDESAPQTSEQDWDPGDDIDIWTD